MSFDVKDHFFYIRLNGFRGNLRYHFRPIHLASTQTHFANVCVCVCVRCSILPRSTPYVSVVINCFCFFSSSIFCTLLLFHLSFFIYCGDAWCFRGHFLLHHHQHQTSSSTVDIVVVVNVTAWAPWTPPPPPPKNALCFAQHNSGIW